MLILGLVTGKAFGQASYCKDYLEDGNPGGTAGLKTFEEQAPAATPASLFIDIWVCDLRPNPIGAGNELLISGGFEIVYASSITVVDVTMYTNVAGGPWNSGASTVEEFPAENKIRVKLIQFGGVQPDGDNDVILAKLEVEGTGSITFSPVPDFDTVVSAQDGFVYDPEISPNVFFVGGCTIDANCDDGLFCTGVESCNENTDLCETSGNPCVPPDVCDEGRDECLSGDSDGDGIPDGSDNCLATVNPGQEDSYPPQGNGIGDACDCEGDFTCDGDVDSFDLTSFLTDFGRGIYDRPCTNGEPCNGDSSCDGDVDSFDITLFLEDFGRGFYDHPCPACVPGDWCVY